MTRHKQCVDQRRGTAASAEECDRSADQFDAAIAYLEDELSKWMRREKRQQREKDSRIEWTAAVRYGVACALGRLRNERAKQIKLNKHSTPEGQASLVG